MSTNERLPWLALGGGVVAALGTFLPWMTGSAPFVGTVQRSGHDMTDADAAIIAFLGLVAVGVAVSAMTRDRTRGHAVAWLVAGGLGVAVVLYDFSAVSSRVNEIDGDGLLASLGYGLFVTLLGVAAVTAAGALAFREPADERPALVSPPEPTARAHRPDTPASWLADPSLRHQLRYWDGSAWTAHVSDNGATATDPL